MLKKAIGCVKVEFGAAGLGANGFWPAVCRGRL